MNKEAIHKNILKGVEDFLIVLKMEGKITEGERHEYSRQWVGILTRIFKEETGTGKQKAYISGQITGLDIEVARSRFNYAAQRLEEMGYDPVNPFDNGLSPDRKWTDHMRADLKLMLDCQTIYLLKGWQHSRGASLERHIAGELLFGTIEQLVERGNHVDKR